MDILQSQFYVRSLTSFAKCCENNVTLSVHVVIYVVLVVVSSKLRPRLYGEKLSRIEGLPAYPSYPGRANFSYISLQNLANRLHEKQKVGSARRVTRLAGLPFCVGRVTLLAGPTFLHINTGSPSRVNSVKERRSEHARALLLLES